MINLLYKNFYQEWRETNDEIFFFSQGLIHFYTEVNFSKVMGKILRVKMIWRQR